MEVVSNEKLLLNSLKGQLKTMYRASRTIIGRLKAEDNPKKALKLEDKLEED